MLPFVSMLVAYLLGSVLFGPLVARRSGVDLHEDGSGNPGATNVERLVGKRAALVVLALDAAKGAIAVAAHAIAHDRSLVSGDASFVALAAVAGHCFPIAAPSRGGKGVATALGAIAVIDGAAGLAFVGIYALVRRATGYGSVASIAALLVSAAVATARSVPGFGAIALGSLVVLVVARHSENLRRLARGEEPHVSGPPPDVDED